MENTKSIINVCEFKQKKKSKMMKRERREKTKKTSSKRCDVVIEMNYTEGNKREYGRLQTSSEV